MTGWRQVLAASLAKAACNAPFGGGAANKGPMMAKRKRAQRSWCGTSMGVHMSGSPGTVPGGSGIFATSLAGHPGAC